MRHIQFLFNDVHLAANQSLVSPHLMRLYLFAEYFCHDTHDVTLCQLEISIAYRKHISNVQHALLLNGILILKILFDKMYEVKLFGQVNKIMNFEPFESNNYAYCIYQHLFSKHRILKCIHFFGISMNEKLSCVTLMTCSTFTEGFLP